MQLLIKQRVFTWRDTFDIYDRHENPIFYVEGKVFSFGHQLDVFDRQGEVIGRVQQRLLTFMPTFELEAFGRHIGAVKKEFSFLTPKYNLDYKGWRVEGNMFGWDYDIYDGSGRKAVTISKQLFTWGDTYVLDIANDEDTIPGLLVVIAIDAANSSKD